MLETLLERSLVPSSPHLSPAQLETMDLLRDSTIGQLLNHFSAGRVLPYADQRASYTIPIRYTLHSSTPPAADSCAATLCGDLVKSPSEPISRVPTLVGVEGKDGTELEKGVSDEEKPVVAAKDPYLVDWDGPDDPDNPR